MKENFQKILKNPKLIQELSRFKKKLQQGNFTARKSIYYARVVKEGVKIYFQSFGGKSIISITASKKAT